MNTTATATEAWTGVVLAGGRSSRMGRDKARLPWQGRPLLEHMQALLRAAGAARVLVSGDYPEYAGIADRWPDLGPLGGLCSLAPHAPDGVLVVVPVDMPRLTPALLRRLAAAAGARSACFAGSVLPLRLQLDADSRAALEGLCAAPPRQRSLHGLLQALGGQSITLPASAAAQLTNCNTPEQWQELQA